jgi:hypothetical protein
MELLVIAIVTGIVVYGLERNRARQADQPQPHLSGSVDVVDRDAERVAAELIAH